MDEKHVKLLNVESAASAALPANFCNCINYCQVSHYFHSAFLNARCPIEMNSISLLRDQVSEPTFERTMNDLCINYMASRREISSTRLSETSTHEPSFASSHACRFGIPKGSERLAAGSSTFIFFFFSLLACHCIFAAFDGHCELCFHLDSILH